MPLAKLVRAAPPRFASYKDIARLLLKLLLRFQEDLRALLKMACHLRRVRLGRLK